MAKAADAVDIHAHFFPERYLDLIERAGGAFGASVDRGNPKGPAIVMRGSRTPPLDASYWDLDRRRRAMDRQGVAMHALSLTVPMVYFADGELERATDALVTELVEFSPLAQRTAKKLLNDTEDATLSVGIELEGHCYSRLRTSEDFREGVTAFHAKRKPQFKGS